MKKTAKKPVKKKLIAKKLPRAKTLHSEALRHNWDDGPPSHIVDDPDCDYGTALAIYWFSGAGFDQQFEKLADVDTWRRPSFRFTRNLEKRLLARDFKTADILFNPRFDRTTITRDGHDWTAEYSDVKVKRPIPDALKEPSRRDAAWEKRGRKPIKNTANRLT